MSRLSNGGLIDRRQPIEFKFDGKSYQGFAGDTLASALIANGVRIFGRSFKYHRPRGVLTAGSEEPNALVTLRSGAHAEPNTRATTIELFDGLDATSQNRWPSLNFDIMSVNQLAAPIFVAGFYYKTFMWPAGFWEKLYEPLIRRAAGLGALSMKADPDTYDGAHAFCDLLVIGAGPAGLAAALAAGRAGKRVVLAEEDWKVGGRLLTEKHEIDGKAGSAWAQAALEELAGKSNVTILTRTSVFGLFDGEYAAVERVSDHLPQTIAGRPKQRLWKITPKRAILATGALERPLIFGGNDRPGVMLASAVSTYVNRFAAVPGKRVAVFTTTDSGWRTVDDLLAAGVAVTVVEARPTAPAAAAERARAAGAQIFTGAVITDAHGKTVKSVDIRTSSGQIQSVSVDAVATAGGWNPAVGLGCNMGARPVWSDAIHSYVLNQPPKGMTLVGAAAGHFSLGEALKDGFAAGDQVARDLGHSGAASAVPRASEDSTAGAPLWSVGKIKTKAFVDFQNDVTDTDVDLSAREGFTSVEHLKRYTALGMATDQGKTSQVNANALLAEATKRNMANVGTILSRPPYVPVSIGVLAGHHREEHFRPARLTASHAWAKAQNATFVDAGQWKRAQWYNRPGENDWLVSCSREVTNTRTNVGFCDVSTLGKIDVCGPDAGVLLDRLYINAFSSLGVGKARYGAMLREDGIVLDDGTATRFAEDHYFVTTTTANAARIMQHVDYARQVLWPELDVQAVSVTEQWSQYSVAGPQARNLLQKLLPDVDMSNEGFPFMGVKEFLWDDIPTRIFRVSFSGELAFEIGVPAHYGHFLVQALHRVGQEFGAQPYGTEALGVMRIEKGHVGGGELNGMTTAQDLGLGRMASTKKDYIGRAMAARIGLTDPNRPAFVGFRPVDTKDRLRAGAHFLPLGAAPTVKNDEGWMTSVAFSPSLGHWIGLGMLKRGPSRIGERVRAYDPVRNGDVVVEVCSPVFIDPEGVRVRA